MTHSTRRLARAAMTTLLAGLLCACGNGLPADSELEWARAALERNPGIEIVATDRDEGVFTVRERDTGALHMVAVADLVAGPVPMTRVADESARVAAAPSTASPSADSPAVAPATEAPAAAPAQERADAEPTAQPAQTPSAPPSPTAPAAAEGGGEAEGETASGVAVAQSPGYTIERSGGRVRVSGPGFSIMSAESSAQPLELAASRDEPDDPIVCEGPRMMHIDGRTLDVDGDAVIARNGCDLHITNSRIMASGVAVTAVNAKVHVTNSTLDGGLRSLELAEGAKAYIRASTLDGIVQRFGAAAQVHDLGGNTW